ncbi:hypothetical protein [Desulfospira joergensenii]|uniref:hypothetical protein n=1 Tax=Desulfospira joergensenii TaxID=53329 RepID=UPI0003B6C8B3|nr:hypothetical protein [Desulfospira joergensenii]
MGTIKDIVDLSTQLANSVQDRKVSAELYKIQSLTLQLQAEQSDLHDKNVQLREALLDLRDENRQLKNELTNRDEWKNKLASYDLVTTEGGATVYKSKGEPTHYICPSCVSKREAQILQDCRDDLGNYQCPNHDCQTKYPVKLIEDPPLPTVNRGVRDYDPLNYR